MSARESEIFRYRSFDRKFQAIFAIFPKSFTLEIASEMSTVRLANSFEKKIQMFTSIVSDDEQSKIVRLSIDLVLVQHEIYDLLSTNETRYPNGHLRTVRGGEETGFSVIKMSVYRTTSSETTSRLSPSTWTTSNRRRALFTPQHYSVQLKKEK